MRFTQIKFIIPLFAALSANLIFAGCDLPELANIYNVNAEVPTFSGDYYLTVSFPHLRNDDCKIETNQTETVYTFEKTLVGIHTYEIDPNKPGTTRGKLVQEYFFGKIMLNASVDPQNGAKFYFYFWNPNRNLADNMTVNHIEYVIGPKLRAGVARLGFRNGKGASATYLLRDPAEEQKSK